MKKQLALPIFSLLPYQIFWPGPKKNTILDKKTNKVWKKKKLDDSPSQKNESKKNRICVFRSYYSKKNKCIKKYREKIFLSLICQNCDSNIIESYYYKPTSMPLVVELVWADSAGWRFLTKNIDLTNFYPIYLFFCYEPMKFRHKFRKQSISKIKVILRLL